MLVIKYTTKESNSLLPFPISKHLCFVEKDLSNLFTLPQLINRGVGICLISEVLTQVILNLHSKRILVPAARSLAFVLERCVEVLT